MKKIVMILLAAAALLAVWSSLSSLNATYVAPQVQDSLFEKAVALIKKYETLHQPRHWPLVGYGHMVLPGEKFARGRAMAESDAEALLRKDLLKNCAAFREYGADSLLLGVLAYNIGSGNVRKSSVSKKLRQGDRDIYDVYVAHCRYRGRQHSGLRRRRVEEFEQLFLTDSVLMRHASEDAPQLPVGDTVVVADVISTDNQPSNPGKDEQ